MVCSMLVAHLELKKKAPNREISANGRRNMKAINQNKKMKINSSAHYIRKVPIWFVRIAIFWDVIHIASKMAHLVMEKWRNNCLYSPSFHTNCNYQSGWITEKRRWINIDNVGAIDVGASDATNDVNNQSLPPIHTETSTLTVWYSYVAK